MMAYPPINELLERVDSKYSLVIATAKRARQITDGEVPLSECSSKKPVTIAVTEIYEDKVECERDGESIRATAAKEKIDEVDE